MSLFWLAYRQSDGVSCVMIVEAEFLVAARLKAALASPGIDEHFASGLELPRGQAIPAAAIGRLLTQAEAHKVVKGLERAIPKKRAAPSIRRQPRKARRVGIKS